MSAADPCATTVEPAKGVPKRASYDVVIVGAGVTGCIVAKELVQAGKTVLLLEAGRATSVRPEGYASYVATYQEALAKTPNSPYPPNPNAPQPSVLFQDKVAKAWPSCGSGFPVTRGYHVYKGPLPFYSTYTRTLGGTTLHFLGTCIRMIPEDFEMQSRFGRGVDWPITYDHLMPYYRRAELEMGVSADADQQILEGGKFRKDYQFPMRQLPPSYLDRWLKANIGEAHFPLYGKKYPVLVAGTPAGRNGMPNPRFKYPRGHPRHGLPYQPVGAPYDSRLGQRCEGNSACVPICPVMAKYNALRTLYTIDRKAARRLELITQAVASKVELDESRKTVTGIRCKLYDSESSGAYTEFTAKGRYYVIAAHAIESAKLLLASNAANSSDQVGRNLMDHPYLLTWGLAPKGTRLGVGRGPQITSELPLRYGEFRKKAAAFRGDIRNQGWDFATGSPYTNVQELVYGTAKTKPTLGRALRTRLGSDVGRQISFGFQIEQLPEPTNRIEICDRYMDQLGNHRPVISYDIGEYTRRGMKNAFDFSHQVLQGRKGKGVGGKDHTVYHEGNASSIAVGRRVFEIHGSGHIMGTHRMGTHKADSVVDSCQRTWDHRNLFLVGCGNMPTIGTSNPTLTVAALAFKAADKIRTELG